MELRRLQEGGRKVMGTARKCWIIAIEEECTSGFPIGGRDHWTETSEGHCLW